MHFILDNILLTQETLS
jgi:hypothetical protein